MIISFTHPFFLIFVCTTLKKLKKSRLAIVNYDLFPEIMIATGTSGENWFYKVLLKSYNRAYRKIDIIISLGNEMTQILKEKVRGSLTKIYTIPNWADLENIYFEPKESNDIILKYGLEAKIVFSYAGTIGRCQGINNLLDLIDSIDYNNKIHFLFFGKGVEIDTIKGQIIRNKNQDLITYAGFIITNDRKRFLNACDVAIISLLGEMTGLNFPSKTYNILASGHPVLFVGKEDCELATMVKSFDIGWVCSSSDPHKFQRIINKISSNPELIKTKGEAARRVAEKHFASDDILNQYMNVFKN